jgi:hypothetical protein
MYHTWSLRTVYNALGIEGTTIPRDLLTEMSYEGHTLTVEPSDSKSNRLYRVFITCACGKRVPFCKMPQHIKGKRHKKYINENAAF